MTRSQHTDSLTVSRRSFLGTFGALAASTAIARGEAGVEPGGAASQGQTSPRQKKIATVQGAFLYPSTESLKKQGYYSWPGSGFDAEGHHRQYAERIAAIARELGMRISMGEKPLRTTADVTQFIGEAAQQAPDGLLLVPLKKADWSAVIRIVQESQRPTVAFATLGILLNPHINELARKPGVYVISSLDNFDAVRYGMKMIRTAHWMKESRIVSVAGKETKETTVRGLGVSVRSLPHARFGEEFKKTPETKQVHDLARRYRKNAKKVVEPTQSDIVNAARNYFACKRLLESEQSDAIMMDCLGGIQARLFPPPCLAFMSLRDEGIAAGCQNDLDATLTMMLLQQLFDRPGFQQNASSETESNHYFGAHCTCPTKLNGPTNRPEPYILRNHAEAGVGAVPQVLWREGQEVTMAQYLVGKTPRMLVYSGKVVRCYNSPPAGGCRTNVEITINETADVRDVKGMHQIIVYGDYRKPLRAFGQLYGITIVS